MPFYKWVDRNTDKSVEILRSISKYDVPPSSEEAAVLTAEEYKKADWIRHISEDIKFCGPKYKGNWNAC